MELSKEVQKSETGEYSSIVKGYENGEILVKTYKTKTKNSS